MCRRRIFRKPAGLRTERGSASHLVGWVAPLRDHPTGERYELDPSVAPNTEKVL